MLDRSGQTPSIAKGGVTSPSGAES